MTILGPHIPKYPIGISDYAKLRRGGFTYVDKTSLIAEVLEAPGETKLIPRPRRFGKTLNMSMLRYFFERSDEDRADLFADTWIWEAEDGRFRDHFGRYSVVSMTFKGIKSRTWEDAWVRIRKQIQNEIRRVWDVHCLGTSVASDDHVLRQYQRLVAEAATNAELADALLDISRWLHDATAERVVVLVDEYDAVLHAAWEHGYWDDAIAFFRDFLSGGFKDASHLFRGVLTGILKVAKENIFSGLNNVAPYSLFHPRMASDFGFTETDVTDLASMAGRSDEMDAIKEWFNGYRFGGTSPETLYNPWSVLMCLSTPGPGGFQSHWKNTSDNALVRHLLRRHAAAIGPQIERLLEGEVVMRTVEESVTLQRLEHNAETVIDLLFFSGYLTATKHEPINHRLVSSLRIPNREVRTIFEDTFADWLVEAASDGKRAVDGLTDAMLSGDVRAFERQLSGILVRVASYHDFGGKAVEAVYQALILGLLVQLESTHRVRSNRESGYGRADVLVSPRRPGPGAVLELKVVEPEFGDTVERGLDEALQQIRDREYASEVRAAGATVVYEYGVVFDGKRCWVRMVE